jgi:hypothetical protein
MTWFWIALRHADQAQEQQKMPRLHAELDFVWLVFS